MKFDDAALLKAIGPRHPAGLTREDRVRLLGEAAEALLAGRMPSAEARLFLAGGLLAWLEGGGSLTKHYLKVDPRRGSKATPSAIWRRRSSSR